SASLGVLPARGRSARSESEEPEVPDDDRGLEAVSAVAGQRGWTAHCEVNTVTTTILGISAFYHDSAAAVVVDGDIVSAAQEERFTRKKHDAGFPRHAVAYCLDEAGLSPEQLDFIAFYDKPMLKFERLLETQLAFAPSGIRS